MGTSRARHVSRNQGSNPPRRVGIVAILAAIALLAGLQPVSAAQGQGQKKASPCCFSNPSYDRICQVQPAGDETCDSILAYLNNPLSTGKTYCDNTKIRGGWVEVECSQPQGHGSGQQAQPSQSQ